MCFYATEQLLKNTETPLGRKKRTRIKIKKNLSFMLLGLILKKDTEVQSYQVQTRFKASYSCLHLLQAGVL